ncbi:MAG: hypothetical protein WD491_06030 [Balneolales bacterium]
MQNPPYLLVLTLLLLLTTMVACEQPGSPDFSTEHALDIPLLSNQKITIMGGGMALIDTTNKAGFDTLFTRKPDGLMSIASEMDFDFGDFGDAIPSIDMDKVEIDSEIGIIEVDDFSSSFESEVGTLSKESESTGEENVELGVFEVSFSGAGSSSFEDVTGQPATSVPAGTSIPQDNADVTIDLDAGSFVSAEVEEGGIRISFTNNLGFDIDNMEATLLSKASAAGTPLVLQDVQTGDTKSGVIEFATGELVETDLTIEVHLDWESQTTKANAGDLEVNAADEDLKVRKAQSDIPAQALEPSSPELVIDNPNFEYAIVEDSGLQIAGENDITIEIRNNTGLLITNSAMNGMPELSLSNSIGDQLDTKRSISNITNQGAGSLGPNETGQVTFDLRNQTLTRELTFDLDTGTPGGNGLTIASTDFFQISSTTGNLNFTEAVSDVEAQEDISLDDTANVEGDFVNAEVEQGELVLTFTNDTQIPLMIDDLRIFNSKAFVAKNTGQTFATGSEIGQLNDLNIPAGTSIEEAIDISGKGISNEISYEGTASTPGTTESVEIKSSDLININLDGSIKLNSATAVLGTQEFSESGELVIDDEYFVIQNEDHFVQLKSGDLRIMDVVNDIDLDIDTLQISFPGIRTGMYQPQDSLVILLAGDNKIVRSSTTGDAFSTSLEGARLFAPDNILKYNVKAVTENTRNHPQGDSIRTVNATDKILASVDIQDLEIALAKGLVQPRTILLSDDDSGNGEDILDLFNENEVQKTAMDGLDILSGVSLSFFEPSLNLFYETNLGVGATVYGAILGVSEDGEQVYLSGSNASSKQVSPNDNITGLKANGQDIAAENLIKFQIEKASDGNSVSKVIVFDHENSTIESFFNNLPEEIRFIGKAIVNEEGGVGDISDPIEFTTSMGVDIPLNLATETPAVFEDTLEVDLSDLPSANDDNMISSSSLKIIYENGMPFDVSLSLEFLDANMNLIARVPESGATDDQQIKIGSSEVASETRFSSTPNNGIIEIQLTREQLKQLNQTQNMILIGDFQSHSQDQINI